MNKLTRRDFLKLIAVGASTAVVSTISGGNSIMSDKPNILFILTDDQRFDTIGALGNYEIKTPTMDSLVRNGVTFTHASIMGSMNGAVCMPSRAQIMSGRTIFHAPDDLANTLTFPEVLQNAGYSTYGIGKWHNQPSSFARCFTGGAKIFFGGMSEHTKVPVNDFDPNGEYSREKIYIGEKFSSELFSDSAVDFLDNYNDDKPFFLYVPYTAPHDPRTPPQRYRDMYKPSEIEIPENMMPEHPFDNGEMNIRDEMLVPFPRTSDIIQQHIAEYYGMLSHLDYEIGRVLSALDKNGFAKNTIIIFAGDNGLALGQHGLMGKQSLYDHSIRVPLIISGPDIPKDEKTDALCYLLDIFPTICDMTGLSIPDSVEGKSLMPLINGKANSIRDNHYYAYKDIHRAIRNDQHKLVEYSVNGVRTTQLFDLDKDPYEMNNIDNETKNSKMLDLLRSELARWQKEIDDPIKFV